ncbi:MAG: hypothetical protein H6R07_349 [Proteobacteria bacterium]|nr:hypothetical protein [Pseudomonadota bacterium]
MTRMGNESSKDRLIIAILISASIHLYLFMPDKYHKVSIKPLSANLQVQIARNTPGHAVTTKIEDASTQEKHTKSSMQKYIKKDFLRDLYVPEEITDSPARILVPFFIESITDIDNKKNKILYIKLKLWINRLGTVDRLEMLESNADAATLQVMLEKIKLSQFEPAIFKGNKVNSMMIGHIEVEY